MENVRAAVLKEGHYTAIPNWIFEYVLRVVPYEASHLLLYLIRKTIGYQNTDKFEQSVSFISEETGMSGESISRWAHAWSTIGFIYYRPTGNGLRMSRFEMFPHGLPNEEQVKAACSGIASTLQ